MTTYDVLRNSTQKCYHMTPSYYKYYFHHRSRPSLNLPPLPLFHLEIFNNSGDGDHPFERNSFSFGKIGGFLGENLEGFGFREVYILSCFDRSEYNPWPVQLALHLSKLQFFLFTPPTYFFFTLQPTNCHLQYYQHLSTSHFLF